MRSILLLLPLALLACDEDTSADDPAADSPTDTGSEDTPTDTGHEDDEPLSFAGTWLLEVDYTLACDWGFGDEEVSHSGTWSLVIEGDNDALSADIQEGWYYLEGSGSDSTFFLSGLFPFQGNGSVALAKPSRNANSFVGDTITADEIIGAVSGQFTDGQGWDCEHIDSMFVLSR